MQLAESGQLAENYYVSWGLGGFEATYVLRPENKVRELDQLTAARIYGEGLDLVNKARTDLELDQKVGMEMFKPEVMKRLQARKMFKSVEFAAGSDNSVLAYAKLELEGQNTSYNFGIYPDHLSEDFSTINSRGDQIAAVVDPFTRTLKSVVVFEKQGDSTVSTAKVFWDFKERKFTGERTIHVHGGSRLLVQSEEAQQLYHQGSLALDKVVERLELNQILGQDLTAFKRHWTP